MDVIVHCTLKYMIRSFVNSRELPDVAAGRSVCVTRLRLGGSVSDLGLETVLSPLAGRSGGGRPTSVEEAATQLQLHLEETVAHDTQLADMARRGISRRTRDGLPLKGKFQLLNKFDIL